MNLRIFGHIRDSYMNIKLSIMLFLHNPKCERYQLSSLSDDTVTVS